jgi:hypothetical protein
MTTTIEAARDDLRDELRALGALALNGLNSPRARALRTILVASAAGQVMPDQARYWALEWAAASGERLCEKSVHSATSKVRVWIVAAKTEAGMNTLATLDAIASAQPGLAGRYAEKATTALRGAAKRGRELTRPECMAILGRTPPGGDSGMALADYGAASGEGVLPLRHYSGPPHLGRRVFDTRRIELRDGGGAPVAAEYQVT